MVWQPDSSRQWYRYGLVALVVTTLGLALFVSGSATATADTDLRLQDLNITGVNKTLDGNITGATLTTTLNFKTDVPDANRRVMRLKIGPSANDTVALDYTNTDLSTGQTSGNVTLSGDVFQHPRINASVLTPAHGATNTTALVVVAEIQVSRTNGESVMSTVQAPVHITLTDDGGPIAYVGGTGNLTVQTDG